MSNYLKLQAQIQKLQKEAESVKKRELAETIANIKKAIQIFGLSASDLGLTVSGSVKRRRKPIQNTTGITWTGRGKQPKWLSAAISGGKTLEEFKI